MAVKVRQDGAWVDVGASSSTSGVTQVALLKDQKNFDVNGGSFTKDAWRDRDLTVEEDSQGFVNFTAGGSQSSGSSGNTPGYWSLEAGTYRIEWSAPGYEVNRHKTRLNYSTTESHISAPGLDVGSSFAEGSTANASNIDLTDELVQTDSIGSKIITITETTYFKIIHWCTNTRDDWGFGDGMYPGGSYDTGPNIYTQVRIENLASAVKNNATYVEGTTRVAYVYDQKGQDVSGGEPPNTTTFNTRDLNTVSDPHSIGVTVTTNIVSVPAGTYAIEWGCPAYRTSQNQTQLVYDDNSGFSSPTSVLGSSSYTTGTGSDVNVQVRSFGKTTVVSSSTIYFKITHRVSNIDGADGLGVKANLGVDNIYTIVKIEDLATAVKDNATYVEGTSKVAKIEDRKPYNIGGGQATPALKWLIRDLNTITDPSSIGITSTTGGIITIPAGTYKINWRAPGYNVQRHTARLVYSTDSNLGTGTSTALYASANYEPNSDDEGWSMGVAPSLTFSATTYFRIEHYVQTAYTANSAGFGNWGNIVGVDNIYTTVEVEDLATAVKGTSGASGMSYSTKSGTYTLVATDDQKLIATDGQINVNQNIFNPADAITIYNNSSSSITISQGTGVTLRLGGTATTGDRTLAQRGIATIVCVATNEFSAIGGGLS